MNGLLGADTRRVDLLAAGLDGYAQDVHNLRTMAQRAVAEMRNGWSGPDFEGLAQRWEQEAGQRLSDVSAALSAMAGVLMTQAAGQRQASGDTRGAGVSMSIHGTPGHLLSSGSSNGGGGSVASTGGVGADASLAFLKGDNGHAQYEVSAGRVEARAGCSVDVDDHGNFVASAGAAAAAYAGYAAGRVQAGNDFAQVAANGRVFVGAEVGAEASGAIGVGGAEGLLVAGAFAGGKAAVNAGGTVAGVTAGAGAEISYGIGARADLDAELSATSIGLSMDVGAALGIGTGVSFDVSVNPQEVMASIGRVFDDVGDSGSSW